MKSRLFTLFVLPLLVLASCLGPQEAEKASSAGASEFNQRVAEDIRSADGDSAARPVRRAARTDEQP